MTAVKEAEYVQRARFLNNDDTWFARGSLGNPLPDEDTVGVVSHELLNGLVKQQQKNGKNGLHQLTGMWEYDNEDGPTLAMIGAIPSSQNVTFYFNNTESGMSGRFWDILPGPRSTVPIVNKMNWTHWRNAIRLILLWCAHAVDNDQAVRFTLYLSDFKQSMMQHEKACLLFLVYAEISDKNVVAKLKTGLAKFEDLCLGDAGYVQFTRDVAWYLTITGLLQTWEDIEGDVHVQAHSKVVHMLKFIKNAHIIGTSKLPFLEFDSSQQRHGARVAELENDVEVRRMIPKFDEASSFWVKSEAEQEKTAGDLWQDYSQKILAQYVNNGSAASCVFTKTAQKHRKLLQLCSYLKKL